MFCSNCGADANNNKFCIYCGNPISLMQLSSQQQINNIEQRDTPKSISTIEEAIRESGTSTSLGKSINKGAIKWHKKCYYQMKF